MAENLVSLDEFHLSDEELFSRFDHNDIESEKITAPKYSYWKSVFRVFFKKKINFVLLGILAVIVFIAFVYPIFVPYVEGAHVAELENEHLKPGAAIKRFGFSLQYIFGTDGSRDPTFVKVWDGARISISLAVICALINMTVGIVIGAIWGFSKKVDAFMTEVYNIIGNVPYILFVSVMVLIFSASFWTMVIALTVTGWLGIAYFIRTQVIIIRDREYNLASRCLGTSMLRMTLRNILPFMTSIIVTLAATEIPSYISYEAFLSFIGVGLSGNSLGKLIQEAKDAMQTYGQGWQFWSPVAVISIITVVLYVVGQNLGDASDPRTHR